MMPGRTLPQRDWYEKWTVAIGLLTFALGMASLGYTYVHNKQISEADQALRAQLEHSNSIISGNDKIISDLNSTNTKLQVEIAAFRAAKEVSDRALADAKARDEDNANTIRQLQGRLIPPTIDFVSQASTDIADALTSPKNGELPARRLMEERNKLLSTLKSSGADIARAIEALDDEFDQIDGVLRNPPVDRDRLANLMQKLNDGWKSKREILEGRVKDAIGRLGCHGQV
jgi:hypothetical protein